MFRRWLDEAMKARWMSPTVGPVPTFSPISDQPSIDPKLDEVLWKMVRAEAIFAECRRAYAVRSERTCSAASPREVRSAFSMRTKDASSVQVDAPAGAAAKTPAERTNATMLPATLRPIITPLFLKPRHRGFGARNV